MEASDESEQRVLRELRNSFESLTADQDAQKPDEIDIGALYPSDNGEEDEDSPRPVIVLHGGISAHAQRFGEAGVAAAIARTKQERAARNPRAGLPVVEAVPYLPPPIPRPEAAVDPGSSPSSPSTPTIDTRSTPKTPPRSPLLNISRYSTLPSRSRSFTNRTASRGPKQRSQSLDGHEKR